MGTYWQNLKFQYRMVGWFPYFGQFLLVLLGIYMMSFYLLHMIQVPMGIFIRESFVKIDNTNYVGTFGLFLLAIIATSAVAIRTWPERRGRGVGKRFVNYVALFCLVVGVASKLWLDHLLVGAGYHKCLKHEIHLNPKGNIERKYPPRAWVLDPGDCIKP
jgi:GNAT superfamily N-acetyltransferase